MGEVRELYFGEQREYKPRDEMARKLERAVGVQQQNFPDDLAAYAIICVNSKGEWSLGYHCDPDTPIGPNMLAGLAMVAVQREIVSEGAIKDSLIRTGLVLPDPEQK